MELLYGNWRRYDTVYSERRTDIITCLHDTTRLAEKHRKIVKMGCDGGCISGPTYRKDGTLTERIDDSGEQYNIGIDTANNTITVFRKNNSQPTDTLYKTEVTFVDSGYMLQYHPGEHMGTTFYKRIVGN